MTEWPTARTWETRPRRRVSVRATAGGVTLSASIRMEEKEVRESSDIYIENLTLVSYALYRRMYRVNVPVRWSP